MIYYYREFGEYVFFYDGDHPQMKGVKNLDNIEDIFVYQNLIERLEEEITVVNNKIKFINGIKKNFNDKMFEKVNFFIPIRASLVSIFLMIICKFLVSSSNLELMMVSPQFLSIGVPIASSLFLGIFDFYDYYNYRVRNKTKNALKARKETIKKELIITKSKLKKLKKESKPVERSSLHKEIRNDELNAAMNNVDFYGFLAYFFERYSKAYENGNLEEMLKSDGYEGEFLIIARDYIINNPHNLTTTPNIRRLVRTRQR